MSDTRQQAHELIDSLPETQLSGLVKFLETIVDPVTAALGSAPLEDETESEEDKLAATEAHVWLRQNGGKASLVASNLPLSASLNPELAT